MSIQARLDQIDAVRRLGVRWLAYRLRAEVERRLGATRRHTPIGAWNFGQAGRDPSCVLVDPGALRAWLLENYDGSQRAELRHAIDELRIRRFRVFGRTVTVDDWHVDPFTGDSYPRTAHWSDVHELPGCDLKGVWESSRFAWSFDLVRAHLLDLDGEPAELFWELFGDWCDKNAPNAGVNWQCGQEASVRLLAVTLAVQAMPDSVTPTRMASFERFVAVTAERVLAHLDYARSQRNNHLSSEAMGLSLAAALYPDHPSAGRWRAAAERAWAEVDAELVFEDGGTSQYSLNYHRVFVHGLVVASLVGARGGPSFPSVLRALNRAGAFLDAVMEPTSGSGPFFGHDDGARILPLAATGHRDLRDTVQICAALSGRPGLMAGPWDEMLAWFGIGRPIAARTEASRGGFHSFPDMGVHVAAVGETRAYLRAGESRFRPAHADQLNVDIWHRGHNVAIERGTYAYTADPTGEARFSRSDHHNTIVLDAEDHMPRVGRFLWSRWANGRLVRSDMHADRITIEAEATIGRARARACRAVTVEDGRVTVLDTVEPAVGWLVAWQLDPDAPLVLAPNDWDVRSPLQRRSPGYRELVDDVEMVVRTDGSNGSIRSEFVPAEAPTYVKR